MAHSVYLGWECWDGGYHAWEATHPLYDGAPDSSTKSFYVTAPTLAELKVAIELWERENGLDVTDEIGVEEIYDDTNMEFSDEDNWIFKNNW